ncbi:lateral tail fiber protein [Escherichia phage FritzSarasin]|nr:lateral tail fiber protein [Escherichia phage FritzSarasin]
MAIYRQGQASMDAQGYVTGYDTKWREQLTLIRPGATIFFIDAPFQAAVISEVISDTQIRAITTGGSEIARSNYIILLHDSITVDGLAQDVAETLRYYQSKETQIEEAIEFFRNFDLQKLIDLRDETVRNAASAAQSEQNAQTWAGQSFNHAESAKGYMQQTQQIKDSAVAEINSARDQGVLTVNQTKDQAVVEMNQIKSDTSSLKDQAIEAKTGAESARDQAANHSANALQQANRAEMEADRAHQAVVGYQGWKYERTVNAPAGAEDAKYYPVIFQEKNVGDMSQLGVFFQISTSNRTGDYPYNSASFAGYARTSGWSDGVDSVYGNFTIYQKDERTIDSILMPAKATQKAFAVYIRGGAFPVSIHCESNIDVVVPTSDYAPDGFVENATVFKFGATDPAAECTEVRAMVLTNTGFYAINDYVIRDILLFRDGLGLGERQTPRFSDLDLVHQYAGAAELSGILNLHAKGDDGVSRGYSRVYAEKQGGLWKTTIHTANNEGDKHGYLQFDENSKLSGLHHVEINGTGGLYSNGWITAKQAMRVGCGTAEGGDKDIYLTNASGDGGAYGWVNLLQGNWYGGFWQFGAVRGGSTDIAHVKVLVNNQGSDVKEFRFHNDYGGYMTAQRGFNGQCVQGAWGLEWDHMGAPYYANSVTNNDSGWSPVVSGGSLSTGGYHMRVGLGVVSNGNAAWPDVALKLNGDGRFHRAYHFTYAGDITTWEQGFGGGAFIFAKNPTSDRDLKHDIKYTDGKESYDRVMQWLPAMFKYNGSDVQRFGLIAQDLLKIDPQYVKLVPGSPVFEDVIGVDENGEEYIDRQIETDRNDDTLALDSNVMLTDMACAMVYMGGKIEKMEKEIDDLRKAVAKLINNPTDTD